jgi:hypothetical protein
LAAFRVTAVLALRLPHLHAPQEEYLDAPGFYASIACPSVSIDHPTALLSFTVGVLADATQPNPNTDLAMHPSHLLKHHSVPSNPYLRAFCVRKSGVCVVDVYYWKKSHTHFSIE